METARLDREDEGRWRSRWTVAWGAGVLLWCAWWYCRGESQGLLWVSAGLAALAVALPRSLPNTTRWVVWTWVTLTVVCLSANVTRLVPPENTLGEGHIFDRVATVAYAVGMSAIFFKFHVLGITKIAAGGLPMAMLILSRNEQSGGVAPGFENLFVWGFVALVAAADQVRQMTEKKTADRLSMARREVVARWAFLLVMLGLAAALREPVGQLAVAAQRMLFGLTVRPMQTMNARRSADMSLSRALPKGFGERMRTVLLIQAKETPGYLRESVYTVYREGTWLRPKPGSALQPVGDTAHAQGKRNVYPLVLGTAALTTGVWQVEVHAPRLLSGICVPGNAVTLMGSGLSPLSDTNGMVTVAEEMPDRYEVAVTECRWNDSAYPGPDGATDPTYLAVPPVLSGAVSNWVEGCAGLAGTPSVREAVKRVEDYFATNFSYRLDVQMKPKPDPLVDFMARREGFCIHFASAAALMFRSRGIPARVIGGFACGEWNSWLARWVVREREGHAWAEVWDAAEGRWLLVEATPPGSRPEDLAKPGKMRLVLDLLSSGWKRVVFWLKNVNVLAFVAEAGAALFFFLWSVVWSPTGMVLLAGGVGVFWWRWRRLRGKPAKEERLRAELTQAVRGLVRRTVPERLRRRENESWDLWLKRVEPALTEEAFTELRAWIEGYQHLRYRTRLDVSTANDWLARVRRAERTRAAK